MASKDESSTGSKSRVKTLFQLSLECTKKNVGDANVVDVWRCAEAISRSRGDEELKISALEYLEEKDDKVTEVPGMEESFQSP